MCKYSSVGRLCYPKSLLGIFADTCTKIFHVSTNMTKDLRIYAQKKQQQMIIIKSSNNPFVDVLRPAQKLQVWNTYIPASKVQVQYKSKCTPSILKSHKR